MTDAGRAMDDKALDLVRQLREHATALTTYPHQPPLDCDCPKCADADELHAAADAITQLRSERDRLNSALDMVAKERDAYAVSLLQWKAMAEKQIAVKDAEIAEGKAVEDCLIVDYQTQYAKAQKAEREAVDLRRIVGFAKQMRACVHSMDEEGDAAMEKFDAAIAQEPTLTERINAAIGEDRGIG